MPRDDDPNPHDMTYPAVPPTRDHLREERDRFVAFAFAAADLLMEVGADYKIRFATGATFSLTHQKAEDLIGHSVLDLLSATDRPLAKILLGSIAKGGRLAPIMVQLANEGSTVILGGCRLPSERDVFHLTLSTPVSAVPMDGERTENGRDPETRLLDRDSFVRRAVAEIGNGGKLTLLTMGGLDELRRRVDGETATGLMNVVGRHLRARSVGGDGAGRLSADRFGLVHDGALDVRSLGQQIAEIVRSADPRGRSLTVGTSTVDLDRGRLSDTDAARILVYAINRFAEAKQGNFTIQSLSEGLGQLLREAASNIRQLRTALSTRQFDLAFQPIVELESRNITHYEALARFAESESPAARIAFAEQVGVVNELDLAVCDRVLRALEERKAMQPAVSIAVNLSGRSLESAIFRAELEALLKTASDLDGRLLLEVTESAIISRPDEVALFLQDLRRRGIRICLDDFGTGAASFDYLNAFAVDFVKLAGKYTRNVTSDPRDRALIEAIVALTRKLGAGTIAEMVETEAQSDALKALGVGYGQGYLFGRPGSLPAAVYKPRFNLRRRGIIMSWG